MKATLLFGIPVALILLFAAWMLHMVRTDTANRVDPAETVLTEQVSTVAPDLEQGRVLYVRHGCAACHGEAGRSLDALTAVNRNFPDDAELIAWIRNPQAFRPRSPMPGFADRIPARDYVHLIAWVRELGER